MDENVWNLKEKRWIATTTTEIEEGLQKNAHGFLGIKKWFNDLEA